MAEIVNLRQARKRKERADRDRVAAENRALHGRSKAERQRDEVAAARAAADLDGHQRERRDDPD
ncbi:DUF4169 family protein [Arvimicrobium flavum]|uniref:DUF4169 family protein n=1 Tax=Arvimicrobium flavum TaxID=3393320 RepID=UPI00237A6EFA|nr:DUF4169 family protein [Mesorhizobium shangrilense]